MDIGDLEQLQASFRHEAADLLTDLGAALLLCPRDSDCSRFKRALMAYAQF
jgi:hypothetical protein